MLQLRGIKKTYVTGDLTQVALNGIDVDFRANEFVAILGPSGSGKTTLLNIIGGLDRYDEGNLIINGVPTKEYKEKDWDSYRNHSIGFIFQSYNLIQHQSILSNVELSMTLSGVSKDERKKRAIEALTNVGLEEHIHKKPNQLSGGQMQRVAIARALVNNPDIILADEPTGALDSVTSVQIMEILKEVAKEKLVIMVTHNPELAEDYATRIIKVRDGNLISDSMPVNLEQENLNGVAKHKNTKLNFKTALSLSLNNLMTKKGRTLLTAFAGAIGIIGIAMILSLSNGVNDYISKVESDAMGNYPITISKKTIDMSSMMQVNMEDQQGKKEDNKEGKKEETKSKLNKIYTKNIVADTVKNAEEVLKTNNIKSFKDYLETNKKDLEGKVTSIEYSYGTTPQVYRTQGKKLVEVSPASLVDDGGNSYEAYYSSMMTVSDSNSSSWSEMVDDKTLRDSKYELVTGKWPEKYNEVVLVVNEKNKISDFNLYTLGVMDINKMEKIIKKTKKGKKVDKSEPTFSYDDIIGKTYTVLAPYQLYKENSDGIWVSKKNSDSYIKGVLDKGIEVKIIGILRVKDSSQTSTGVAYTRALTKKLIDKTAKSTVVKQQMNNKKVNVLTGEKFKEDDNDRVKVGKSTSTTKIASIRSFGTIDGKSNNNDNNNAVSLSSIDIKADSVNVMLDTINDKKLSEDENNTSETGNTYTVNFVNFDGTALCDETTYNEGDSINVFPASDPVKASSNTYEYIFIGWRSSSTNATYKTADLPKVTESVTYTAEFYEKAITTSPSTPTLPGKGSMPGMDAKTLKQLQKQMKQLQKFQQQMKQMQKLMGSGAGFSLSEDQIAALLSKYSNSTPNTYSDVLDELGYSSYDEPSNINIYPLDFDSKDDIDAFIKKYNKGKKESQKITYNDLVGAMTSSVKSIVNTISTVLIAFVAISLIVSSIMIAIITYISVLERTKEIGVLRALGASKRDVSKIFNAETFIEGLISGIMGIATTLLLSIPINRIVEKKLEVQNICNLHVSHAIILIAISVILTLIAGYIPSKIAAKKDPVTALRTE